MRDKTNDTHGRKADNTKIMRTKRARKRIDKAPTKGGHVAHSPYSRIDKAKLVSPAGDGKHGTAYMAQTRNEGDEQDF